MIRMFVQHKIIIENKSNNILQLFLSVVNFRAEFYFKMQSLSDRHRNYSASLTYNLINLINRFP